MTEIRRIVGPMPFDRHEDGVGFVHATGREVLTINPWGDPVWVNEYEDWATVDLPETETEEEYERRCLEAELAQWDDAED